MKKSLLILMLIFSTTAFFGQNYPQPTQFNNACDINNNGIATFYMQEISFEIVDNNPNVIVTHHLTQLDATTGLNALPTTYTNTSNPQTIFARVYNTITATVETIMVYNLTVNPLPANPAQTLTVCANNGNTCWDLTQVIPNILSGNTTLIVSFFLSSIDAQLNVNPIINPYCFISPLGAPIQPPLYYNVQDQVTGCSSVGVLELVTVPCTNNCLAPTNVIATNITNNSAVITWGDNNTNNQGWEIMITSNGVVLQGNQFVDNNPYVITQLPCDAYISVSVRSYCSNGEISDWSTPFTFMTSACGSQFGQPQSFSACVDQNAQACFNLTDNDDDIIGTMNPSEHTITYHASASEAEANVNPLSSPYCVGLGNTPIYGRITHNDGSGYFTTVFYLNVSSFIYPQTLVPIAISQCDDNGDGAVIFNLTSVQSQIITSNTLFYFTTQADAENVTNQIVNPTAFTVNVQAGVTQVFIREIVANDCDRIYILQLTTFSNCNLASNCNMANSLCSALGIPFPNSVNLPSGGTYGCLNSTPNPTWFYLPISQSGNINLMVQQNSSIDFNTQAQDVDYAVFGPFTDPVTPCVNQINASTIVSCSYSSATTEFPVITNAISGQYYLIMVTNFSNQAGYIKITDVGGTGQGAINCSGLRLNAFLDSNNNGSQDNGEQNFPLGQFNYEVNSNGVIHNVTAPTGFYNIYDVNTTNSYSLNYTIDSAYSSMYSLSASYNNIHTVTGGGMIGYNFPITIVQPYNDLAISIIPVNSPRPGFTYENKIIYSNLGNQNVASGSLSFTKDASLSITNISQAGTTTTANGFSYNFTNLAPFESRTITVTMQVPTNAVLGSIVTNSASIVPLSGEMNTLNNDASVTQTVIGSFDPNDKMESHGEKIVHSTFTTADYLFYTIRFENTGTASAINVKVNDVLDSKLDESSVRMVSSSHNYTMDRIENNLSWKFDNIQLPVSVANTTTGKGFITFKVKPNPGFAVGDIIPNTAAIYFDFNAPVITNTFNTEFVSTLAASQFDESNFVYFPNPVKNNLTLSAKTTIDKVEITSVLGQVILSKNVNDLQTEVNLSELSKGIYLVKVTSEGKEKTVKIVKE